jgi:hypothetical protein
VGCHFAFMNQTFQISTFFFCQSYNVFFRQLPVP